MQDVDLVRIDSKEDAVSASPFPEEMDADLDIPPIVFFGEMTATWKNRERVYFVRQSVQPLVRDLNGS